MRLLDSELEAYIREDIPYFDLTTEMLALDARPMQLEIFTREAITVACVEEAARIAQLLGCESTILHPSGTTIEANSAMLRIKGAHQQLHQSWRVCQILLEYACGIATKSALMKTKIRQSNAHCELYVTRKSFPFAKRFVIRAVTAGGALPHRLGLSESLLVFDQHRMLYEHEADFYSALKSLIAQNHEKKVVVESETIDDAKTLLSLGVEVLQMDKCSLDVLSSLVAFKTSQFPHARILAAGGINPGNIAAIAATGIDGVVSSAPYSAGMADLSAKWTHL